MLNRLILFLIRRKFGLRKNQRFQFANQRSKYNEYYFSSTNLMKIEYDKYGVGNAKLANVKLNWLLGDKCKIKKV